MALEREHRGGGQGEHDPREHREGGCQARMPSALRCLCWGVGAGIVSGCGHRPRSQGSTGQQKNIRAKIIPKKTSRRTRRVIAERTDHVSVSIFSVSIWRMAWTGYPKGGVAKSLETPRGPKQPEIMEMQKDQADRSSKACAG